ncbi:DUF6470 family protein [Caenibacillus caldisaponilyticus]|uniref:DUF6470 family protein n=1 Tax=Caenibacillus caldisaponilyticus TaxID=1674942 RepID=UPI0009883038|nr:DUF6470 family protein [Caenibacillus caldisaponilyticus]
MDLPHLVMHSVMGRIGIRTQRASLDPTFGHSEMSIRQPKAEMTIQRTQGKVMIDQTEAWHNLDLKSAIVRNREAAEAGREAVLEGIARRAEQGDELMRIEKPGNPIVKQAIENSERHGTYDTGHVPPALAVKINGQPGTLDIRWQTHRPEIEVTTVPPRFDYRPGSVTIYMIQYPALTIDVVGGKIDLYG